MKVSRFVILSFIFLAIVFVTSSSVYGENITYRLLPGSTITPVFGSNPVGETETLTGTFEWDEVSSGSTNLRAFNASALHFKSLSYEITLNTTTLNDVASTIFTGSNDTYFNEVVDLVGLPISTGRMGTFSVGTYSGPSDRPEFLNYPDIRISPVSGGSFHARLNLIAEEVKPNTLKLTLSSTDDSLNLDFEVGTEVPANWNAWLTFQDVIGHLLFVELPVISSPMSFSLSLPFFPPLGTVGVLTTLTTPEKGIVCSDFKTVNTGDYPAAVKKVEQVRLKKRLKRLQNKLEKQVKEQLLDYNLN